MSSTANTVHTTGSGAHAPAVGHVMTEYLVRPMAYIYQQISSLPTYRSRVFCERHIDDGSFRGVPVDSLYRYPGKQSLRGLLIRTLVRLTPDRLPGFVARQVERHPVQLLHVHFGTTALRLTGLRRRCAVPLMVTFYGRDASSELRTQPEAYRRLFAAGDMFVVQGEQIRDRLIAHGCPPDKLSVWDLGIDLGQFPYQPRDTTAEDVRFITAARFVEKKGYPLLLDAFARLVQRAPNAHLTILGKGPLKGEIMQQMAALGLTPHVTLIDTSAWQNFNALYAEQLRNQHIFVLPAVQAADGDEDGLPVVLQNALASGLPAISTPIGGIPRAIVHGSTGYLVPSGNVDALAEQMTFLAQHRELWNELGRRARQHVEEHFELAAQGRKVEAIYGRLLARSGRAA